MRKSRGIAGCVVWAAIASGFVVGEAPTPAVAAPDGDRPRVVFGSDQDFPPYEWLDEDGVARGFNVDLIRAIADAAGLEVVVALGPWSTMRRNFEVDRTVDIADMYWTEARTQQFLFTTPFTAVYDTLFARRDSPELCDVARLRGHRVLAQRDSFASEYLRSLSPEIEIVPATSEPDALLRLAAREADCALVGEVSGRYIVERDGLTGLVGVGPPINPRPYSFVVMPDRADLAAEINRGLALVRKDGRFGKIYQRWFGQKRPRGLSRVGKRIAVVAAVLAVILGVILAWSWTLRRKVASQTASLREQLLALTEARNALRKTEDRLRTLIEHAPEAILVYDVGAGRFIDSNANAEALLGLSRDEILARGPLDVSEPEQDHDQPAVDAWRERVAESSNRPGHAFEWIFRGSGDQPVHCELRLVKLPGADAEHIRVSAVDIRSRRMLEEQLRQAQRLEGIGRLAGGVAHDFNNLLTVIMSQAYRIQHAVGDSPLAAAAQDVRRAADRAAALTRQLLAFSRRQLLQPRAVEVAGLIEDMERLLSRLLGEDVALATDLRAGDATVRVDPGQLEQVLINLVINARDAMPDGGCIEVRTRTTEVSDQGEAGAVPAGRYVVIDVVDNGVGMSTEVREKVFEPFYTTKAPGKGTGLGLATVYGIVKQSGGHITVASELGRGSTFSVFLPQSLESAPAREAASPAAEQPDAGSGKLLLVEDDAQLRGLLTSGLQRRGFDVLSAAGGREALRILDEEEQVDLLITDVVMPGMSGLELARNLDARPRAPRVLFVTGYADDESARAELCKTGSAVLVKPFHVYELVQRVRELLENAA